MGLVEATKKCLNNYATFQGRASRSEFWFFYLAQMLAFIAVIALTGLMGAISENLLAIGGILYIVLALGLFIPTLAVSIRRLHDTDRSGWWYLLIFVPFGAIVLIVFFCLDSTPGNNQFGPNPKGITNSEVFS